MHRARSEETLLPERRDLHSHSRDISRLRDPASANLHGPSPTQKVSATAAALHDEAPSAAPSARPARRLGADAGLCTSAHARGRGCPISLLIRGGSRRVSRRNLAHGTVHEVHRARDRGDELVGFWPWTARWERNRQCLQTGTAAENSAEPGAADASGVWSGHAAAACGPEESGRRDRQRLVWDAAVWKTPVPSHGTRQRGVQSSRVACGYNGGNDDA